MMFIELEDTIINTEKICSVQKKHSPYDPNKVFCVIVHLDDESSINLDKDYYEKLSNILKPTKISRDNKEGFCQ